MNYIFSAIFIPVYIILSILCVTLLVKNFNFNYKVNYSFKRFFPFEIHNFKSDGYLSTLRIFYSCTIFLPIILLVFLLITADYNRVIDLYLIVSLILLDVSLVCEFLLFITKTLNIKLFLKEFLIRYLSMLAACLLVIVGCATDIVFHNAANIIADIIFIVLFSIISILLLFMALSKKLSTWYIMDKDEKGKSVRPKVIYLAYYQWIIYFIEVVSVVLIAILFMVK